MMIEASIEAVRINVVTDDHLVILREINGSRLLPIWIGPYEAQAIALEIKGTGLGRPLTHDLLRDVIGQMGGSIERIVVSDIREKIFYATIIIEMDGRRVNVDSRPSDALALAVRTHSPIYIEDAVIEQAGIPVVDETPEAEEPAEAIDPERLTVFREFINNMDVDDPEKGKE